MHMNEEEAKHALGMAQLGADWIIFELALRAGVKPGHEVVQVHEEYLDAIAEDGTYGMEAWMVFEAIDEWGRTYYAHLPGSLDSLVVRTVRDHAVWFEED